MPRETFKHKYLQGWEVNDLVRQPQVAGKERFWVLSPTLLQERQSKGHRVLFSQGCRGQWQDRPWKFEFRFKCATFFFIVLGFPTCHCFPTSLTPKTIQWSVGQGIRYPFYRWKNGGAKRLRDWSVIIYQEKGWSQKVIPTFWLLVFPYFLTSPPINLTLLSFNSDLQRMSFWGQTNKEKARKTQNQNQRAYKTI